MTDRSELAVADATAQADLVARGDATPAELVDAAIARIEATNPQVNAVIHPLFDRARERASTALAGPFAGVPMVVKDLDGQLAGAPLHLGNKLLKEIGYVAPNSSHLFDKFEAAGFVIVGKTNTPEFGLQTTTEPHAYGPTRNPWDPTRGPGGSSGGSAASVAAGLVPVGHAGDGGGSIRIPSSECGLVGLKPSRGRVSVGPQDGEVWNGLVARHVVTRTVRDSAAILDVVAGEMPGDPYTAPPPAQPFATALDRDPRPLRIGLRTDAIAAMCEVDAECAAAAEATAKTLESLGHTVELASPAALDETELVATFLYVVASNALGLVEELSSLAGRPVTADDVEPGTWALAEAGRSVSAVQYQQTISAAHAWTRRTLAWWHADDAYDVLLTPTLAALPPELGLLNPVDGDPGLATILQTPYAAFAAAFNVTGQPAMSVPVAMSDGGLPIGVQLVGAAYREDLLLGLAAQLERAVPWADRRPQIFAVQRHLGEAVMTDELAGLDATAQAELVRLGQLSASELVDAAIARIERLEPAVNAFTTTRFERARTEAAAELPDGPFRGVPFALKDLSCTLEGEPSYDGVPVLAKKDYRAPVTSHLAARFRAIGLVVVGRTNTPELGIMPTTEPLSFGPTHNPWDLSRTPGGSSGGSAAAVAAGMLPFAHASDGGGSIRIPAACCGLVGLKTSRGRTSVGPASDELARPLSVQFAVTRSVRDAAALLDAVAGPEVGDPVVPAAPATRYASQVNIEPAPLRIGLMTTMPGTSDPADPECVAATERTARILDIAGHHVERAHPPAFDETERMTAFIPIWSAMAAANVIAIGRRIGREVTPDDVEPLTWFLAERGREVTGGELLDALSAMGAFARRFTSWWADGWDLLLTPTLGELPPELGVLQTPDHPVTGFSRGGTFTPFTPVANQTGQPAISLPVGQSANGLPIGVHFIAAAGREDLLLQVAGLVERSIDWSHRRAPAHA